MIDFLRARTNMVDCQIMPNGVTRHDILAAFLTVRREAFVSGAQKPLAYIDEDLPISDDRALMEAMTTARLVQLAEPGDEDIVLDVGCATGYSTAILASLCASVVALESEESLADTATANLLEEAVSNAVVVTGPLEEGYAKEGPYDVIYIGGAVDFLPDAFTEQLKPGGRLVVVLGRGNAGEARLYTRESSGLSYRRAFNAAVEPLPGFEKPAEFVF